MNELWFLAPPGSSGYQWHLDDVCKFKRGQKVKNGAKGLIGLPQSGTVFERIKGRDFKQQFNQFGLWSKGENWNDCFPGWERKPVYFVELDEENFTSVDAKSLNTYKVKQMAFAEDDLQVIE